MLLGQKSSCLRGIKEDDNSTKRNSAKDDFKTVIDSSRLNKYRLSRRLYFIPTLRGHVNYSRNFRLAPLKHWLN